MHPCHWKKRNENEMKKKCRPSEAFGWLGNTATRTASAPGGKRGQTPVSHHICVSSTGGVHQKNHGAIQCGVWRQVHTRDGVLEKNSSNAKGHEVAFAIHTPPPHPCPSKHVGSEQKATTVRKHAQSERGKMNGHGCSVLFAVPMLCLVAFEMEQPNGNFRYRRRQQAQAHAPQKFLGPIVSTKWNLLWTPGEVQRKKRFDPGRRKPLEV